jgi:Zn-dependent peptidase ImmA (M78 family)
VARRTFARPERHHEIAAQNILSRHAAATGSPVTLPVPIDLIVESTFGIVVLYDDIPEPPESMILGALFPRDMRIVINTKHQDLLERVIGPERFTLAHELAHWVYDAEDPNQLALQLDEILPTEHYCYDRVAVGLSEDRRLREMNANKLASHVLLPEQLVRAVDIDEVLDNFRATAQSWGVSQQMLRIRLETLGLIDYADFDRLPDW